MRSARRGRLPAILLHPTKGFWCPDGPTPFGMTGVTDCRMDNAELAAIYEADQGDRLRGAFESDPDGVSARDRVRHSRIQTMIAEGVVTTGADYFHAAMIFQHGSSLESFRQAHDLAMRSRDLGDQRAVWLAAASLDRWFARLWNRQLFGTQFQWVDSRWELVPVDPSTTDAERAEWNVPSLAESVELAEQMTANSSLTASVSR